MTTTATLLKQAEALEVIESLRKGIPPKRYTSRYTSGTEDFLTKVRKFHLESASTRGKLRFVSGSWGAGKTHFPAASAGRGVRCPLPGLHRGTECRFDSVQ